MINFYVDINGLPLPAYQEGHPDIPLGAILVTGPAPNKNSVWNNTTKLWEGSVLTWEAIRQKRVPLLYEAVNVLCKYRNQLLQTGGVTDITNVKAVEWADYLQTLRDITLGTDPDALSWPTKPI